MATIDMTHELRKRGLGVEPPTNGEEVCEIHLGYQHALSIQEDEGTWFAVNTAWDRSGGIVFEDQVVIEHSEALFIEGVMKWVEQFELDLARMEEQLGQAAMEEES